jgi:signal transduction histidine kinase
MPPIHRRLTSTIPLRVFGATAIVTIALIILSAADVGGRAELWESLHWNLSAIGCAIAAGLATREVSGRDRRVRTWIFATLSLWAVYNIAWGIENLDGTIAYPSYVDLLGFLVAVPAIGVLVAAVRGMLTKAEEIAVYLDAALVATAIAAVLVMIFGATAFSVGGAGAILAFTYPLEFLAVAGAGLVALLALGHPVRPVGGYALIAGSAIVGLCYLFWVVPAVEGTAMPGQLVGHVFSLGVLVAGFGAITWRTEPETSSRLVGLTAALSRSIGPTATGVILLTLVADVNLPGELEAPLHLAVLLAGVLFLLRQGLLLRERSHMLDEVRRLHEENDHLVDELRQELVERARVQDRLVDASRMAAVGELAAGVAHEVNNPLTGVLGYAEILLEDLAEDDPRRADVATIRSEALRARAIVRALRDFARPREPEPTPTDLPSLVTRTLELVRYPLVRAGVIIEESHGELPLIELDPQAIQQVILNVLTNAMQAMPAGGTLNVETSVVGAEAVVAITDSGVGMDETVAAQAFVPFFSTRRDTGAPGLGLSVSLGLVESHRGTILLQSRPEVGTAVEIRLPIGGSRPASASVPRAAVQ